MNYPRRRGNQHNMEFHDDVLPVDFFGRDYIDPYMFGSLLDHQVFNQNFLPRPTHTSLPDPFYQVFNQNFLPRPTHTRAYDTNQIPRPAFPVPAFASFSQQWLNMNPYEDIPFQRIVNPGIGPHGINRIPSRAPNVKQSRTKPQVVRKRKIRKIEPKVEQRYYDYPSLEELTDMGLLTNTEDHPADYRNLLEATDMGLVPSAEDHPADYRNLLEATDMGLLTSAEDHPADYRNLLEATDLGLVTNTERFDCPICFSDIAVGEGVTLKDCLHNYCRECLAGTIRHSDTVLVKCPFVNDEYSCENFLQEREIKSLLTQEEFGRHLAMGLALVERQSANSFHCKTPDCAGWCLVEDDASQYFCQVCQRSNCLSCAAIHEGKNCRQYQDMAAFHSDTSDEAKKTRAYLQRQLKSNQAMACPTCQVIVMKREGCDWLVCSMCHTDICWATKGPRWGKRGKGDTSGGCKCNILIKRCHPQCQGCH